MLAASPWLKRLAHGASEVREGPAPRDLPGDAPAERA
jgi:hypothetical protein